MFKLRWSLPRTGEYIYLRSLVAVRSIDHAAAHKCLLSLVHATVIMIYIATIFA